MFTVSDHTCSATLGGGTAQHRKREHWNCVDKICSCVDWVFSLINNKRADVITVEIIQYYA